MSDKLLGLGGNGSAYNPAKELIIDKAKIYSTTAREVVSFHAPKKIIIDGIRKQK
jgi:hypothetical protein